MTDNFRFAQLQSYALAGGGAVAGATSITLKSMTDIDGNALSMAGTFGAIGFGTLEPGNGALEEQISFTGLTNNANGTTTLSGVSSVTFVYPYTQTSGLAKTHAGSTTFVISNTSGFYDKLTSKSDDETITGLWDFPSGVNNPTIGAGSYVAPTLDTQIATKKYVDDVAVSGAPNANTTTKGIVQEATQAQVDAKTQTGSTGAELFTNPSNTRSTLLSDYVADTGSANTYAIAPSPVISAYSNGQRFVFKVANTNTGTATLVVNALAATAILKSDGFSGIGNGDLLAGQIVEVVKSPGGFELLTPTAGGASPTGSVQMFAGLTAPSGWLLCDASAISRSTYGALFSVIGTSYGVGNGTSTFNLPDMRGRVPVGMGTGTGGGTSGTGLPSGGSALTAVSRGTWKGEETHVLITAELAAHTHSNTPPSPTPGGGGGGVTGIEVSDGTSASSANTYNTSSTGGDGAHNNIQPVMGLNFIIKT